MRNGFVWCSVNPFYQMEPARNIACDNIVVDHPQWSHRGSWSLHPIIGNMLRGQRAIPDTMPSGHISHSKCYNKFRQMSCSWSSCNSFIYLVFVPSILAAMTLRASAKSMLSHQCHLDLRNHTTVSKATIFCHQSEQFPFEAFLQAST